MGLLPVSLARILLPLQESDDDEAALGTAFALGARFGAQVAGLLPQPSQADEAMFLLENALAADAYTAGTEAKDRLERRAGQAEQRFLAFAAQAGGVDAKFTAVAGTAEETVARHACAADLVVLPCLRRAPTLNWLGHCDGALVLAGRPALIAPPERGDGTAAIGERLVIAWNESSEASRALAAARPFFGGAREALIVTVGGDERARGSAEELVGYLALYGQKAAVEHVEEGAGEVANLLMERAAAAPGGLLVMGAYSHARWRERSFGGVTEAVLRGTRTPVLMSN